MIESFQTYRCSQGFFTSLIYFYFNTEIRYEVLRQVQRTILSNDTIQRSSTGETLSTRLSTFRRSINRHRQSSLQARQQERRRTNLSTGHSSSAKPTPDFWRKKSLALFCPCVNQTITRKKHLPEQASLHRQQNIEQHRLNDTSPAIVPDIIVEDDIGDPSSPLVSPKDIIENDNMTCDTMLMKNENEDQELLTDENEVTIHQTSFSVSSVNVAKDIQLNRLQRTRSNSEGNLPNSSSTKHSHDNKSLK